MRSNFQERGISTTSIWLRSPSQHIVLFVIILQAKKPAKVDVKIDIKTEDEEISDVAGDDSVKRKPKVLTEEKQKMLHTEKVLNRSSKTREFHS